MNTLGVASSGNEPDTDPRHLDTEFYSGYLWQEKAEKFILAHAAAAAAASGGDSDSAPFFLHYAFQTPHDPMEVWKTHFLARHFMLNRIILPSQARDKHGKR